ncbi:MAG: conjugal transfer protein TraX [Burkholderiaceae bacterium]|nr:conjugal transfer protein TraX [Burkholderiaceae bacterium]
MRQPALDAIKWVAIITMTLDHLRFVWPGLEPLSWPGRFAFPAFALVMAAHSVRQGQPGASAWRQLAWLVGFALISQWPYWLFFEREQGNIMLTLACGLGLICGLRMTGWRGTLIAVASIAIPLVIPVSYGLPGVLLPAAFLVALQNAKQSSWALPAAVSAVAQGDLLHAAIAAVASTVLLAMLSGRVNAQVCPVGRWAYAYYPAHLLLLAALAP